MIRFGPLPKSTPIMPPSQLLRKFSAQPRQHDLAIALREVGRIERTLFIIDWLRGMKPSGTKSRVKDSGSFSKTNKCTENRI
jgi:hypothetical protein